MIAVDLFALPFNEDHLGGHANYFVWAGLRDMMWELTEAMTKDPIADSQALEDFKLLLLISHYHALRAACQSQRALKEVAAKLSVSLLRHR